MSISDNPARVDVPALLRAHAGAHQLYHQNREASDLNVIRILEMCGNHLDSPLAVEIVNYLDGDE